MVEDKPGQSSSAGLATDTAAKLEKSGKEENGLSDLEQDTSHVLRPSLRRLQWQRSKLGCRGQGVPRPGPAHTSVPICKDSQKQRASFGGAATEATCSSDSPELIPALNLVLFDPDAAWIYGYFCKSYESLSDVPFR